VFAAADLCSDGWLNICDRAEVLIITDEVYSSFFVLQTVDFEEIMTRFLRVTNDLEPDVYETIIICIHHSILCLKDPETGSNGGARSSFLWLCTKQSVKVNLTCFMMTLL